MGSGPTQQMHGVYNVGVYADGVYMPRIMLCHVAVSRAVLLGGPVLDICVVAGTLSNVVTANRVIATIGVARCDL